MDVANVLSTTFTLEGGKAWYDALHASLAACSLPEEVREVESRFLAEYKASYQQDYIKNACKLKIIRLENPNVPGVELVTALNPDAGKPFPGVGYRWLGAVEDLFADPKGSFERASDYYFGDKEKEKEKGGGIKWWHILFIGMVLSVVLFLIIKFVF